VNSEYTETNSSTSVQNHALGHLGYIRETIESSMSFTAIPGRAIALVGFTAIVAAWFAYQAQTEFQWLMIWLTEAAIAFVMGSYGMIQKARQADVSLLRGAGRRFLLSLSPPIAVAAFLTAVFYHHGLFHIMPGMWLLLFGVGVLSAGVFSVRPVPLMGFTFMACGVLTYVFPAAWSNVMMAIGFGIVLIIFGFIIAKRYGG